MPKVLLIGIVLLLVASCTDQLAYFNYQSTDNGNWGKDQVMEFRFSDLDSTQSYNMYITLRNDEHYPYSNLFLIAEMSSPDGTSHRDTLEFAPLRQDEQTENSRDNAGGHAEEEN